MRIIIADEIKYALKDDKNYDIYWITSESNVFEWAILLIFGGIFSILFGLLTFGTGTLFVMSVVASNLISFIQVAKQFYKSDQQAKLNANIFAESLINAINKFNQLLNQDKKIKILFKHKQNLKLNLYTKGGSGLVGTRYKTWIKFGDGQQESFVNFNPFRMIALLQLVRDNNNKDTIDALIPVLALYDTSIKRYGYYRIGNNWYDFESYAPIVHFELKLDNFIIAKHYTLFNNQYDIIYLTKSELDDFRKQNHPPFGYLISSVLNKIYPFEFHNDPSKYQITSFNKKVYELQSDKLTPLYFLTPESNFNLHFLYANDYKPSYIGNDLIYINKKYNAIDNNKNVKVYEYDFTYKYFNYIYRTFITKQVKVYTFDNVQLTIKFKTKLPAMNIFDLLTILNNYKQLFFRQQLFFRSSDGNIYLRTKNNLHDEFIDLDKYINILIYEMPYQVYTPDEIPELDLDYEIIRNENNYTLKIDKITILPIRIEIRDKDNNLIHRQFLNNDLIINLNYEEKYKIQYFITTGFDSLDRIGNLYEKIIIISKNQNDNNNGSNESDSGNNKPIGIKPIDKPKNDFKPSNLPLDSRIIIPLALLLTLYVVFKNRNEN
ncbi:MAG: hypothetical protein ACO2O4_00730 [Minisyncoccia bacterium]|jgi:hypothetical protein